MSTIETAASRPFEEVRRPGLALVREIRGFWRQFIVAAFDPYRPELHYMRGPGPAWQARHGLDPGGQRD